MTAEVVDIAVIGLGVMGRNLALHLADAGFVVTATDPFPAVVAAAAEEMAGRVRLVATPRAAAFGPDRARRFLVMIKAGDPIDALLADLDGVLRSGDVIVDGGNSHWQDTERRERLLAPRGIRFVGLGVSGGREGARHGASLMAGGDRDALAEIAPLLAALAARAPDGTPCHGRFGDGGAGHFVKMAHNGIEYAQMQLWAEAAVALLGPAGLAPARAAEVVAGWAKGPAASYLLDATAVVLRAEDLDTGRPLVEIVADRAAHKGTGKWTVEAAAEFGVAVPSIAAAYFARILSAERRPRPGLARPPVARLPVAGLAPEAIVADLAAALPLAMISAYLQGLDLIVAAARARGWDTDPAAVVRVWRAGCIIRADMLTPLAEAVAGRDDVWDALESPFGRDAVETGAPALRRLVASLAGAGVPIPGFASVLAHLDGLGAPRLGASVIQGQRDLFGDHSFERVDRPGAFHHDWARETAR